MNESIARAMVGNGVKERVALRYANVLWENGIVDLPGIDGLKLSEAETWRGCGDGMMDALIGLGAVDDRPEKPVFVREPRVCARCGAEVPPKSEHAILRVTRYNVPGSGFSYRNAVHTETVGSLVLCTDCAPTAFDAVMAWADGE